MSRAITVRVQPRARRNEVVGERGDAIVVRLTAPPVGGKANTALRRLIAKRVGMPPSSVEIVRGAAAREKLVRVRDLDARRLRAALLSDTRPGA